MKTRIYIIIASVLMLATIALVAVVAYVLLVPTPTPPKQTPGTVTTFPSSGTVGTGTASGPLVQIPMRNGEKVAVKDFVNNGTTIEDRANPGNYYLAGESGYCDANDVCLSGAPADNFKVVYFSGDQSFVIALTKEPLKQARLDAQVFLQEALGISGENLCMINYYLSTDTYVNSQYADTNLGFSFCPGATILP